MRSRITTSRTDPRRINPSRTGSDAVTELPVIEFPDLDADTKSVDHPYAAAERVLSASS